MSWVLRNFPAAMNVLQNNLKKIRNLIFQICILIFLFVRKHYNGEGGLFIKNEGMF